MSVINPNLKVQDFYTAEEKAAVLAELTAVDAPLQVGDKILLGAPDEYCRYCGNGLPQTLKMIYDFDLEKGEIVCFNGDECSGGYNGIYPLDIAAKLPRLVQK